MDTIETIDPDADPLIGEQPGVGDRQRLEIAPTLRLQLRRARLVIDIPQRVLQIENERGIETSRGSATAMNWNAATGTAAE